MSTDWSGVLLDLLNSTPVVDGVPTDVLDGRWLSSHGADVELVAVQELRDELQGVVRGAVDADVLSRHLRQVRRMPVIDGDGLTWELAGSADWTALVVLAWGDLQARSPGRLRACANHECQLFLIDRSRGGTGRWCSMSGCGNRMKARRHYGRAAGRAAT